MRRSPALFEQFGDVAMAAHGCDVGGRLSPLVLQALVGAGLDQHLDDLRYDLHRPPSSADLRHDRCGHSGQPCAAAVRERRPSMPPRTARMKGVLPLLSSPGVGTMFKQSSDAAALWALERPQKGLVPPKSVTLDRRPASEGVEWHPHCRDRPHATGPCGPVCRPP